MGLPQFVAFQVHIGQGDSRGRAGGLGKPGGVLLGRCRGLVG